MAAHSTSEAIVIRELFSHAFPLKPQVRMEARPGDVKGARRREFRGHVSLPGLFEGAEPKNPRCKSQALVAPTLWRGVTGELGFVLGGERRDYENVEVQGKVALVNAEDAGAIAATFMSYSELIGDQL